MMWLEDQCSLEDEYEDLQAKLSVLYELADDGEDVWQEIDDMEREVREVYNKLSQY